MNKDLLKCTKLRASWNGYQYLLTFLIGFVGDIIIHMLSSSFFYSGDRGPFSSLMYYYNSLKKVSIPLVGEYLPNFLDSPTLKMWIWGGIFGGLACIIALLGSDIILEYFGDGHKCD
jgi:hypothetical protein